MSGWCTFRIISVSRYPSPNFNLLYAGADLITNQACIDAYDAQSIRDSQMCTIRSGSAPCAVSTHIRINPYPTMDKYLHPL